MVYFICLVLFIILATYGWVCSQDIDESLNRVNKANEDLVEALEALGPELTLFMEVAKPFYKDHNNFLPLEKVLDLYRRSLDSGDLDSIYKAKVALETKFGKYLDWIMDNKALMESEQYEEIPDRLSDAIDRIYQSTYAFNDAVFDFYLLKGKFFCSLILRIQKNEEPIFFGEYEEKPIEIEGDAWDLTVARQD